MTGAPTDQTATAQRRGRYELAADGATLVDPVTGAPVDLFRVVLETTPEAFLAHARPLLGLDHPHLARIRALDCEAGEGYVVSDAPAGRPVSARDGWPTVVRRLAPIARAVAHVHAHGLAHGAITLEALRATPDGTWYLTGLGPAWVTRGEQNRSHDLLALIGVLVALCVDPAPGTSLEAASRRLPTPLTHLAAQTLTGQIDTAHDLAEALEACLPVARPRPDRPRWLPWAAGLALLALGGLAVWHWGWPYVVGAVPATAPAPSSATQRPVPVPSPALAPYTVSGRVHWGQQPLAGVQVVLSDRYHPEEGRVETESGPDGTFTIPAVTAPYLTLVVSKPGYHWAPYRAPAGSTGSGADQPPAAPAFLRNPLNLLRIERRGAAEGDVWVDVLMVREDFALESLEWLDERRLALTLPDLTAYGETQLLRFTLGTQWAVLQNPAYAVTGDRSIVVTVAPEASPEEWPPVGLEPQAWPDALTLTSGEVLTVTARVMVPVPDLDARIMFEVPVAEAVRAIAIP